MSTTMAAITRRMIKRESSFVPRHLILIVLVMVGLAFPRVASACSCVGNRLACEALWDPGAVFAGKVVAIERNEGGGRFAERRVRFQVVAAFRGVTTSEIDVYTGAGGGDCGYSFMVGASYLVYSYQAAGASGLTTGICSRTRLLSQASEDLEYIRRVPANGALGATITGAVYDRNRNVSKQPGAVEFGTVPRVGVALECGGALFRGTTDADGRFSISGVPVGSCTPQVEPSAAYLVWPASAIEIHDPRACADVSLQISSRKQ
jgi:hypothetical protein